MHSQSRLSLLLLGPFALIRDGQPRELAYEKGRALLAFLAAEPGRSHPRAFLATLLWPALARTTALANLRQVLHNLRPIINGSDPATTALKVSRDAVSLHSDVGLAIDAVQFLADTPACTTVASPGFCAACLTDMEAHTGLYRGEFLESLSLPDCLDFEDWLQTQREALLQRALGRLTLVSDCHERAGANAKSLPFAQRLLELDPWNEPGLRRVMRLLAVTGQRDAALAKYEKWCRVVKEELGLSPSDETLALSDSIRKNERPLAARRITDSYPKIPLPAPQSQRRQVTVLHCALETDTEEDPDVALTLLRGPQMRCSEIIRAYSGYLVQAHGGSLLAYFGYPQASENAARQAVHAGLELTRTRFQGIDLRIGVHTGMVISGGEPDVPDAIGATSGMAIRLRQQVSHGEIAISHATQRLVAGYFECISLGLRPVSGKAHPVEAFRVVRGSGARDRLEAAPKLTPLIGRTRELATLLTLLQDARQGVQRAVLLRGEAGIGKSRVVQALKDALQGQAVAVTELRCLPEYSQSPFYPLVSLFHVALDFLTDDTTEVRFDKLARYVEANYPSNGHDTVPLLAKLLSLSLFAPYGEPVSTPQAQREQTLEIILNRLYAMASPQPVLLVVEDLHWADPSSLELLHRIVAQKRSEIVLALFTARSGFRPPWSETLSTPLTLEALNVIEARTLIGALVPKLDAAKVRTIVERADGIPLFVEELAKEVATHDLSVIPSTLQDLLAARLDGMGAAKIVAQLAATIGREFGFDLLRTIAGMDEPALGHYLRQLRDGGLLRGDAHTGFYFGHALMRDAAYQSQTRTEREAAHRRIAAELTTAGPETRPELLAQHWAAGGAPRQAARSWVAAGQLASQHSAYQEAILHFKAGLALIETLPTDPDQIRMELDLQIGLGAALCATQGYTCAAGAEAYRRAVAVCTQHEGGLDMFVAVWGLWAGASLRVNYDHSQELAQQLLRMADQSGDPIKSQQAHFAAAITLFRQGHVLTAYKHFQSVRQQYERTHRERHLAEFGEDVGVTNGSYISWVLWFMGFPEQAAEVSAQTLTSARRLGHPFSLAYALTFAMVLRCNLRQPEASLALTEETLVLASKHGFALWQMGAMLARGWALAQQHVPEGANLLQQCVHASHAARGAVELIALVPLVDAYVCLGNFDAALRVIDEAFAIVRDKGDHHLEAELYRLKGESLLGQDTSSESDAEYCFQQALAISQQQQTKTFELRAAVSLARLWQKQGKHGSARDLLAAVYGWFTEGLDTPDLLDARRLLDGLVRFCSL